MQVKTICFGIKLVSLTSLLCGVMGCSLTEGPLLPRSRLRELHVGRTTKGEVRRLFGRSYVWLSSDTNPIEAELARYGMRRSLQVVSPMIEALPQGSSAMYRLMMGDKWYQETDPRTMPTWTYERTRTIGGTFGPSKRETWRLTVSFDMEGRLRKFRWRWRAPELKTSKATKPGRWERVSVGMGQPDVERLIGKPAQITVEGREHGYREEWFYGPIHVAGGSCPRVVFSESGAVIKTEVGVPTGRTLLRNE